MPLITFEGVEGCGKSTQLARAAPRLRQRGHDVLATREPGGSAIGEKIRAILMDTGHMDLDPLAEWLLLEADRRQHVAQVLQPSLAGGSFVLCDRYADSTEAYQQKGRGIDSRLIAPVDEAAREGLSPDLTLLYDLDPSAGLARARARDSAAGRFEAVELEFHRRVRNAFLDIARREPDRVRVISADASADAVFEETWRHIERRFRI